MATTRVDSTVLAEDNLESYFRELHEHDLLTAEQEIALAQDIERNEIAAWLELLRFGPVARTLLDGPLGRVERELASRPALEAALAAGDDLTEPARVVATELVAWDHQRRLRAAARADLRRGDGRLGRLACADLEAAAFWRRVDAAEDRAGRARAAFITANLRLVVAIARRFRGRGLALADLVQEGNLGLMRAVERFDYRKGFRFSTFAGWWIMASVRRAALDKGRTVRVPIHMVDEHRRLDQVRRDLLRRLGRPPSPAELAEASGITAERLVEIERAMPLHALSLDKPTGEDEDGSAYDVMLDPEAVEPPVPERLHRLAIARELERLVERLTPVEADVIRRRYGMGDADEQTLQEIGDDYARSRERIRQIEARALAKLRRALRRADRPDDEALGMRAAR